ncbi:MAG: ATP-binding cassette domain-containing protein, partial [Candidatus Deferrimicrobiota bacterium]
TVEGEFLVLLGPSGCGKTTLLRMIAGIEEPTAGDILIDERVVTHLPPRMRNIAMVFQSYALYPHMTVYRNIAFPLRTRGVDKGTIREKVEWAAGMFGIERLLDRKPRELSGGERQRVALARAMVREPSVFLLDEPLSNLDAILRASAREELRQFQKRVGVTTIYVTHDQVEAMGLGDRIVVMSKGSIRQVGTPMEIYHWPADTFVATFLGSPPMNILGEDDTLTGFRPETFLPAEFVNGGDGVVTYPFDVTWTEYLGAERLVYGFKVVARTSTAPYAAIADPADNIAEAIDLGFGVAQGEHFAARQHRYTFFTAGRRGRGDQTPQKLRAFHAVAFCRSYDSFAHFV